MLLPYRGDPGEHPDKADVPIAANAAVEFQFAVPKPFSATVSDGHAAACAPRLPGAAIPQAGAPMVLLGAHELSADRSLKLSTQSDAGDLDARQRRWRLDACAEAGVIATKPES